jgi:hypothetical protein
MACIPCLFLPALVAGSGAAGGIEGAKKNFTLMWVCIAVSIIGTILWIFFAIRKKRCKACLFPGKKKKKA